MRIIKSVWLIINYKTLIVSALAIVSIFLCEYFNLKAEFPLTLVGVAIVFPVVGAGKRSQNGVAGFCRSR